MWLISMSEDSESMVGYIGNVDSGSIPLLLIVTPGKTRIIVTLILLVV